MPALHVSRRIFATVAALVVLARMGKDDYAQSADIHRYLGLTPRYLESALQVLKDAGLVSSMTGPNGGYRLDTSARQLTLLKVAEWVSTTEELPELTEGLGTSKLAALVMIPRVLGFLDAWHADLHTVTIAQLAHEADDAKVERFKKEPA